MVARRRSTEAASRTITFRCTPTEAARLAAIAATSAKSTSDVLRAWIVDGAAPTEPPPAEPYYVDARPGSASVEADTFNRWQPRYVWTLHYRVGAPSLGPLAVRRRILRQTDGSFIFEIARREGRIWFERHHIEDRNAFEVTGCVRARASFGYEDTPDFPHWVEVHAWVYDHNPTANERAEWVRRHTIEQSAIRNPPAFVWAVSDLGRVKRCASQRNLGRVFGDGNRFDLEVDIGKGPESANASGSYESNPNVDLLDLMANGSAELQKRHWGDPLGKAWTVFVAKPSPADVARHVAQHAAAYADEQRRKASWGGFRFVDVSAKPDPLAAFELSHPCTPEDVQRAYRKRIALERLHPDQGGDAVAFSNLTKMRDAALAAVASQRTTS